MANHGSIQAEHSKTQAQCSLKTASPPSSAFSCRTTSCPTFTHQLSQRPHPTCRIEHTSPLHLKNISFFNHISTQNLSTNSPSESQRKHASAPLRPFGASTLSQDQTSRLDDEYPSTPRCTSRLLTSEETTTLEKI